MDIRLPNTAAHVVSGDETRVSQDMQLKELDSGRGLHRVNAYRLPPSERAKVSAHLAERAMLRAAKAEVAQQSPVSSGFAAEVQPGAGTASVSGVQEPSVEGLKTSTESPASSAGKALPDFPGAGSEQEKIDFVIQLFKDHPKATRSELEAKYTYTDATSPHAKTGPLRFAGGGQGNVIFLEGTPYVIKKELAGPEAETYSFFHAAQQFLQEPNPDFSKLPAPLKQFSLEALEKMHAGRAAILAGFPIPKAMEQTGNTSIVVAPNVAYANGQKLENCSIEDIKIGSRIVSKKELALHGSPEASGFSWIKKCIATRLVPLLKGTPSRGYEYVSQSTAGGVRQAMDRLLDGQASEKILENKCKAMTKEQRASLAQQLQNIIDAHDALPITFVGSSVMIALPDPKDRTSMPRACMGDFAHAMFTAETAKVASTGLTLGQGTYDKYKDNFAFGIKGLHSLVQATLES